MTSRVFQNRFFKKEACYILFKLFEPQEHIVLHFW